MHKRQGRRRFPGGGLVRKRQAYLTTLALATVAFSSSRLSLTRLLITSAASVLDLVTSSASSRVFASAFSNADLTRSACLATLSSGEPAASSSATMAVVCSML